MRERIVAIVVLIFVFLLGICVTLCFTDEEKTTTTNKNITIKESDSIYNSVQKVYDSVVLINSYKNGQLVSSGSGFIYKKNRNYGYIMTNYHVISSSEDLKVVNTAGETLKATFLGGDSYTDIAILRIDSKSVLAVSELGKTSDCKIGDTVFAVGTPLSSDYMGTVTKGIISSEIREITVNDGNNSYMMEAIQTDASINPGNSGGPLVNINGEVIGVNSMKLVKSEVEGMGFAIPIEIAMASVDKLENGEKIERPYLGISMYDTSNSSMAYKNNLKIDKSITNGVVVADVENNSVAEKSGIRANDIIIEINGETIENSSHLKFMLYKHKIGDTIKLTIIRDNKKIQKEVKLTKALKE